MILQSKINSSGLNWLRRCVKWSGRMFIASCVAVFGTLSILLIALWWIEDPILKLTTSADRHVAMEDISAVFSHSGRLSTPGGPSIYLATGITLRRVAVAVILSTLLGVVGGFVLCKGQKRWKAVQPILDFLRSTPATLWIGVAGAFFLKSNKEYLSIVLATVPCSLIMLFQVRHALSQEILEHRHVFQMVSRNTSSLHLFCLFTFPMALPGILTGLRLILSYGLVLVVVLEMCGASGANSGLGDVAMRHSAIGWPAVAVAWYVGCIGFALNKLMETFEEYLSEKLGF